MLATSGVGFGGFQRADRCRGRPGRTAHQHRWPAFLYSASPLVLETTRECPALYVGTRGDKQDDENHPGEIDYPSWKTAYALCPHGDLAEPLMELTGLDGRLRDSVAIT